MNHTYSGCTSIIYPVFGENVTEAVGTYDGTSVEIPICPNGIKVFGPYGNCKKITQAVCGNDVIDFNMAYRGCTNLTKAVCGPNV
jgi:hypothetical protein